MAKLGEGDQRWIVEERKDGANVHGWHWVEKDCKEWTRVFFESEFVCGCGDDLGDDDGETDEMGKGILSVGLVFLALSRGVPRTKSPRGR